MAWIKQKIGKCIDCPAEDKNKPLQAKRCTSGPHYHYSKYKRSEALKKKQQRDKVKRERILLANDGKSLAQWYADQISMLPKHCEECGEYLNPYHPWGAHVYIAHIVPKRNFESVCVHPFNRMFFCGDCHNAYDEKDSNHIVSMKSWPMIIARFKTFKYKITQQEYSSLQECFMDFI